MNNIVKNSRMQRQIDLINDRIDFLGLYAQLQSIPQTGEYILTIKDDRTSTSKVVYKKVYDNYAVCIMDLESGENRK